MWEGAQSAIFALAGIRKIEHKQQINLPETKWEFITSNLELQRESDAPLVENATDICQNKPCLKSEVDQVATNDAMIVETVSLIESRREKLRSTSELSNVSAISQDIEADDRSEHAAAAKKKNKKKSKKRLIPAANAIPTDAHLISILSAGKSYKSKKSRAVTWGAVEKAH